MFAGAGGGGEGEEGVSGCAPAAPGPVQVGEGDDGLVADLAGGDFPEVLTALVKLAEA